MLSSLDTLAHMNRLRHVDARLKVGFAIPTLLITIASPSPIPPIIAFITATCLIMFAKIKLKTYFFLMSAPLLFGLVSLLLMTWFFGYGVDMGLLVASRTLAGSSLLFFLTLTTPITELFAMLRFFKIPDVVIELAMIIYRYIFVFLEEAERMVLAYQMRGDLGFRKKIETFSMLLGTLFLRTIHQGEKLFIAMNSRCYDGGGDSLSYQEDKTKINIPLLSAVILFEAALAYITILTSRLI